MKAKIVKNVKGDKVLAYNTQQELCFFGKNLKTYEKSWSVPLYVYSLSGIRARAALFQEKVSQVLHQEPRIYYAMKANSHPKVLQSIKASGFGVDVVSGGELRIARRSGFSKKHILYSGVGKTQEELLLAIKSQIFQINVESIGELERISLLARKLKKNVAIGLRVNPEVNPKTHPYIATGFRENKFGIEMQQIPQAIEILRQNNRLLYQGLSLHIGSQIFDFSALEEAIEKALDLESQLQGQGFEAKCFDIGGGIGIDYHQDAENTDELVLDQFCQSLKRVLGHYQKPVLFEPGRFLVARFGLLLTQVQYIKRNRHKNFIICDSGMNHLIRPALYESFHRIFPVRLRAGERESFDVVGPVCESGDFFAKDRELVQPHSGDLLCITDAGAYGASMSSDYNSFPRAKEIFIT